MAFYIVSKRALVRELLGAFCTHEGFRVLGEFETLAQIPDMADAAAQPDAILHLSSFDNPEELGIDRFRARFAKARIILLAASTLPAEVLDYMSSRVEATILDNKSLPTLTSFLTLVQEGFSISAGAASGARARIPATPPAVPTGIDRANGGSAQDNGAPPDDPDVFGKLSARELAVIARLRNGASNKDIAKELNIVESTVKVHLRGCFRKIGVQNRTQAAIWAAKHLPHSRVSV